MNSEERCPCLSGEQYGACCEPIHQGHRKATTAEQLMRSRYSAFFCGDSAYLLDSWHPDTRPHELHPDETIRWVRLDIVTTHAGRMFDTEGTVEFRAYYRTLPASGEQSQRGEIHEVSRFSRVDGRWLYVDGISDLL
ncbi:YchJ family metal-binding protein [Lysinibacter sp. HNR]|nr:YchJ family metal-binding protein [Lysinibacter sp. HNR]WGD38632.1 YchJ family metal-binding protein [Lysinibacter sp. HNR]